MITTTNAKTRLRVAEAVVAIQEPGLHSVDIRAKALAGAYKTIRNRKTIYAYINQGRWVADCPCNGAEIVEPGEDMLCGSCSMVSTVAFPDEKTRQQIETALLKRHPLKQNWTVEETVAELEAQNIENGLWEDI